MSSEAPAWQATLRLALVPKTGEPYRDEFELPLEKIEHWGQEYVPAGPLAVRIESSAPGGGGARILLKIMVSASFTLPCSRCLRETGLAIVGDLRYLFTLRQTREDRERMSSESDSEDGDVDVIHLDSFEPELDLVPYIWETLILHLPEGVLCSEDCKGICPVCGADLNESDCTCGEDDVDPRFAVLRDIES